MLATMIHYTVVLLLIFILVWATQFMPLAPPLHNHAYRDVFLNFTGIYAVFIIYELITDKMRKWEIKFFLWTAYQNEWVLNI